MHGHSLLTVQIVKFSQLGHKSYQYSEWKLEEGGGGGQTCLMCLTLLLHNAGFVYIYLSLQCLHSHLKGLKTRHIKKEVNMWIEMLHGHTYWKWT